MSNKEQKWHKATGLCFVCHKPGHFSQDCPDRNKVSSTESDEPPGGKSFGINVTKVNIKNQHELSARSQDCGLTVNNIHIPKGEDEPDDNTELNSLPGIMTDDLKMESDFSIMGWYLDEIGLSCMEFSEDAVTHRDVECNKAVPSNNSYPALEQNPTITKDVTWMIPKLVIIIVHVNGQPARALVDTGSLADFMLSNLAEQLKVKWIWLEKSLPIQLAIQGS